jgi:hypothetical protein
MNQARSKDYLLGLGRKAQRSEGESPADQRDCLPPSPRQSLIEVFYSLS